MLYFRLAKIELIFKSLLMIRMTPIQTMSDYISMMMLFQKSLLTKESPNANYQYNILKKVQKNMIFTFQIPLLRRKLVDLCLMFIFLFGTSSYIFCQSPDLSYYLPPTSYNTEIQSPQEFFGFEYGKWHLSSDQVQHYAQYLSEKSDRVEYHRYGKSHTDKELFVLFISNPKHIKNKDYIRDNSRSLCEPRVAKEVNINTLPTIIYQAYTVHGNEPSGTHAAVLLAYHLAAGQSDEVNFLLENNFILLDLLMNPDGYTRFTTWVNSHKSNNLVSTPSAREFNEIWPGGRTNHYWFDLNRDWLPLIHPESQGRIALFQQWKPNILTDYHEMGKDATYFFQPGVPERTNPNTPAENQMLTEEIARFHAKALDGRSAKYYSKANFDDFYYGKGSTYPDIHGCIGILFEQASSRGHAQMSTHGLLRFEYTIANQVATSLSSLRAGAEMRTKLHQYKRRFYEDKLKEGSNDATKGWIFTDKDPVKVRKFIHLLRQHEIEVEEVTQNSTIGNNHYLKDGRSYLVKSHQNQYGLIKTIFETVTSFRDSIFYDISTWTMPLAFGLQYDALTAASISSLKTKPISKIEPYKGMIYEVEKPIAHMIERNQNHALATILRLQTEGYQVYTALDSVKYETIEGPKTFSPGSFILFEKQLDATQVGLVSKIQALQSDFPLIVHQIATGNSGNDISLGHPEIVLVPLIRVAMIVGDGVSPYDAGAVWHYMDHSLGMAPDMIDKRNLGSADLSAYSTIILVSGRYQDMGDAIHKKIENWVQQGGQLLVMQNAISYATTQNWIKLGIKDQPEQEGKSVRRPYASAEAYYGSQNLGGVITQIKVDPSHPLGFGYEEKSYSFKNNKIVYELPSNPFSAPWIYEATRPIVSGYIPKGFESQLANTAAVTVHSKGSGKIIALADHPLFRGYWLGGARLFENILSYGSMISRRTTQSE